MARHVFTKAEQIRGIEKALNNPKTPAHLKDGLRKRLEHLKRG